MTAADPRRTPRRTPRRPPEWMAVGPDDVIDVHRGARRHTVTALVAAALVVVAVAASYPTLPTEPLRGFIAVCPGATVLGLLDAVLVLRAVRHRAAVGECLDRRLGRTVTKALLSLALMSWVVGVLGTLLLAPGIDPVVLPVISTVLGSTVLSYLALACDRWFRPRSAPPGRRGGS